MHHTNKCLLIFCGLVTQGWAIVRQIRVCFKCENYTVCYNWLKKLTCNLIFQFGLARLCYVRPTSFAIVKHEQEAPRLLPPGRCLSFAAKMPAKDSPLKSWSDFTLKIPSRRAAQMGRISITIQALSSYFSQVKSICCKLLWNLCSYVRSMNAPCRA